MSSDLPPVSRIDYGHLGGDSRSSSIFGKIDYLRLHLPVLWQRAYAAVAAHIPNIVCVSYGPFEYICDSYSGMEACGEVAFDQRVRDRTVGVLGTSSPIRRRRRGTVPRDWVEHPEEIDGSSRDKGHFIAHAFGGGLDMNVFSQARDFNRGISDQGKIYRQMERYCYENAGTFCVSRPIYDDATSIPRWIEFGLLRGDGTIWVEIFDNS